MAKSWDNQRTIAETGSTRSILPTDHTTFFHNLGGGACTWTLPAMADLQVGWWVEFACCAAGDQVYTASADDLILYNDGTATSLTVGTDGEEIGFSCKIRLISANLFFMEYRLASETQSVTVA